MDAGGDEVTVRRSAVGPDGQQYLILSYGGAEGRGPATLLVPDRAPRPLRSALGLVNRVLRAFQPSGSHRRYAALGVFLAPDGEGELDQIHEARVADQREADATADRLVGEIEAGTFRPNER